MRKAYAVYTTGVDFGGSDILYEREFATRLLALDHMKKRVKAPNVLHCWVQEVATERQSIDGVNLELYK
jgi:hypothetical protein